MAKDNNKKLAQIFHFDLYGKREEKYSFLLENDLQTVNWQELQPASPDYFFVPKDFSLKEEYEKGFKINELFSLNSVGIVTANDSIFVNIDKNQLINNIKNKFNTVPDNSLIKKIDYRPFDTQFVYYDIKKIERARENVMQHFIKGENCGLIVSRQCVNNWQYVFVAENIANFNLIATAGRFGAGFIFPLYLYQENFGKTEKVANLNEAIVASIRSATGTDIEPIEIFDYLYAVLHSPSYRDRYKEFLKIDFPRIPYPENAEQFKQLAGLGAKLRKLHLMENVVGARHALPLPQNVANFPVAGTNEIETLRTDVVQQHTVRVFINDTQYFDNVPQTAWEFYIGGYQPAQKWLKDRKGRTLGFDDVQHYQQIIAVLIETERIMEEIDINSQSMQKNVRL
jgi:predicted helicase